MEAGSAFTPTHTAPAAGLPTWSTPDPAAPSDNRLDPHLAVQVMEETTGWAHILCANGWTAWVDSRHLVAVPGAPAARPVPELEEAAVPPGAGSHSPAGPPPGFSPGAAGGAPTFAPPAAAGAPSFAPASAGGAPAAAPPAAAASQAAPRRRGRGRFVLFGCLGILLLVIVAGVGIFVALQTHAVTTANLLNVVGQGPAVIEVDNFRDDQIVVGIDTVSSSSGGGSAPASPSSGGLSLSGESLTLNAFDVKDNHAQNPGKYRVTFRDKAGADLGSCTLDIHGGDHYQFVALPSQVAVNRANNPSSSGPDFIIQTSKLCKN